MSDAISREAALAELERHAKGATTIGGQTFRTIQLGEATDAIAALPAAPTFTAADLERAWEMGRDAVQVVFLQPCGTVRVRRPKNPPADLAQRVKEDRT